MKKPFQLAFSIILFASITEAFPTPTPTPTQTPAASSSIHIQIVNTLVSGVPRLPVPNQRLTITVGNVSRTVTTKSDGTFDFDLPVQPAGRTYTVVWETNLVPSGTIIREGRIPQIGRGLEIRGVTNSDTPGAAEFFVYYAN